MLQQAIQVVLITVWTLFACPIAGGVTPQGLYTIGAGLLGPQFLGCCGRSFRNEELSRVDSVPVDSFG